MHFPEHWFLFSSQIPPKLFYRFLFSYFLKKSAVISLYENLVFHIKVLSKIFHSSEELPKKFDRKLPQHKYEL